MVGVKTKKCEHCGRALLATEAPERVELAELLEGAAQHWRENFQGASTEFWAKTLESAAEELRR
jgi:hypothetical protein